MPSIVPLRRTMFRRSAARFAAAAAKMYKIGELYKMLSIPLSEFRANASAMIALVEQGETVRILRHGKPVAELVATKAAPSDAAPSWKRTIQCVQYQRPPARTVARAPSDDPTGAGDEHPV